MAVSRGLELHPDSGPKVAVGIPKMIGDRPEGAVDYLRMAGGALVKVNELVAYISVQIGRQLVEIRESALWTKIERRDYREAAHPDGIPQWSSDERERYFLSFHDFIENGFPMIAGYSGRQAFYFLRLAKSEVVANLSDYELTQMKSTRNILSMVKIEEVHGAAAVTDAMREDAKKLDNNSFNAKWEVPKPVVSNTVPEASDKQFIVMNWLARISSDELRVLKEVVADGLVRCGDSASDLTVLVCSVLANDWGQDDARQAEDQNPIQMENEFVNGATGEVVEVEPEVTEAASVAEVDDRW